MLETNQNREELEKIPFITDEEFLAKGEEMLLPEKSISEIDIISNLIEIGYFKIPSMAELIEWIKEQ